MGHSCQWRGELACGCGSLLGWRAVRDGRDALGRGAGLVRERKEGETAWAVRVAGPAQKERKWAAGLVLDWAAERGSSWARGEVGWASWAEGWVWVCFLFLFLFFFKLTQIQMNSNQI